MTLGSEVPLKEPEIKLGKGPPPIFPRVLRASFGQRIKTSAMLQTPVTAGAARPLGELTRKGMSWGVATSYGRNAETRLKRKRKQPERNVNIS